MSALVIGVDPGGTTGVCWFLTPEAGPVTAAGAIQMHGPEGVLPYVLQRCSDYGDDRRVIVAIEKFVVNSRAGRSRAGQGGQTARALIAVLVDSLRQIGPIETWLRPAGAVKPWAVDKRLEAAGLLEVTQSLPHARDAARHALYAAVKAGLMPDPLVAALTEEMLLTGSVFIERGTDR